MQVYQARRTLSFFVPLHDGGGRDLGAKLSDVFGKLFSNKVEKLTGWSPSEFILLVFFCNSAHLIFSL